LTKSDIQLDQVGYPTWETRITDLGESDNRLETRCFEIWTSLAREFRDNAVLKMG